MKQCCSIYRHPLFERKKKAWHLFEAYRGAVFAEEQGCIQVLINYIIDITFFFLIEGIILSYESHSPTIMYPILFWKIR